MRTAMANVFRTVGLITLLAGAGTAKAQINAGPYVPTPWPIVTEMMKLANLKSSDFIIDLGSGDGRLVITAAKQAGLRGFGVDINPELVKLANENAKKEGVGERVEFVRKDLFETDLSQASIITVYLLPSTVTKLVPKMMTDLKPGSRVVSHDYPLVPWQHDSMQEFNFEEKKAISGTTRTILFHYTVPARVAGTWEFQLPATIAKQPVRASLAQDLTIVSGSAVVDGRTLPLAELRVQGESISFQLPRQGAKPIALRAVVSGDTMQGTADAGGTWQGRRVAP